MMKHTLALALMVMLGVTTSASASITISAGPGGGNPDENILFTGPGVVLGPGNLVTGRTNSEPWLLDFTSTDQIEGNGGQARIEPDGSAPFGNVTLTNFREAVTAAVIDMTDLKFNVDAADDGSIQIDVYDDAAGTTLLASASLSLGKNGQNFFRIVATGNSIFGRVTLTSVGDDNFDKLEQVRISGTPQNVVPEPASLLVWSLIGLGAIPGAVLYRRRKS